MEVETEFAWQQLILNSYGDKIVVNEKEIDEELNTAIKNQKIRRI